jgi:hypothetical protein
VESRVVEVRQVARVIRHVARQAQATGRLKVAPRKTGRLKPAPTTTGRLKPAPTKDGRLKPRPHTKDGRLKPPTTIGPAEAGPYE